MIDGENAWSLGRLKSHQGNTKGEIQAADRAVPPMSGQDGLNEPERFKNRVGFLAKRISGWSKRMDSANYGSLLKTDKLAGRSSELSDLIYEALLRPMGRIMGKMTNAADMKTFLDVFESSVPQYLAGVAGYASSYGITKSSIVERLEELEKKLSSWCNDE